MLGADIVVVQIARLFNCVLNHFLGARSLWKLAHGHHLGTALDQLLNFKANLAQINAKIF